MLDPDRVDLRDLAEALDDHSIGVSWYLNVVTGEVVASVADSGIADEAGDDDDADLRYIEPVGSHHGYRDMADFVAGVQQRRASDLLERAITGRGAFRRFKDTLVEFPELREQWFRFRDARSRRRAAAWLADQGLVERATAERLAAAHPDPATAEPDLPAAVAADLRTVLGDRLERVLLLTDTDDALAVAVVLADLQDPWDELRVVDDLLWRHTEASGRAVTALPVGTADLAAPATAALRRIAEAAALDVGAPPRRTP